MQNVKKKEISTYIGFEANLSVKDFQLIFKNNQ